MARPSTILRRYATFVVGLLSKDEGAGVRLQASSGLVAASRV